MKLTQRPPNLAEWLRHQSHGIYYMAIKNIFGRDSVKRNEMTFANQETKKPYKCTIFTVAVAAGTAALATIVHHKLKWWACPVS